MSNDNVSQTDGKIVGGDEATEKNIGSTHSFKSGYPKSVS